MPGLKDNLAEINYQVPLYTKSQNGLAWRGPLKVMWSNHPAEAYRAHRAGCPIPGPGNIPEERDNKSGHPVPMLCHLLTTEVLPDS